MLIVLASLLLTIASVLEGCTAGVPAKKIESLSPDARHGVLELPIYTEGDLTGKEHAVVDSVKGTSCQYAKDDPAATETDAINEVKYWAKAQGAEGLKNVRCDAPHGRTLFNRCRERITCTGQAIKFAK